MSLLTEGFGVATAALPKLRAGCDPGKQGWIAVETSDGDILRFKIPVTEDGDYDEAALIAIARKLKALGVAHVTLEAQQPTYLRGSQAGANNAVKSSFMIGMGYMAVRMALTVAGIPFDLAWPSHWKKTMGINPPKGTPEKERERLRKQLTRDAATNEWPGVDFRPSTRARVPSHDLCEAALLIRYGQKRFPDALD